MPCQCVSVYLCAPARRGCVLVIAYAAVCQCHVVDVRYRCVTAVSDSNGRTSSIVQCLCTRRLSVSVIEGELELISNGLELENF